MKYLLITLLLFSTSAFAQETCEVTKQDVNTPVPADLKDATIIIRTKDGKETKMKANDFKVVKRKQQFKVKEKIVEIPCEPEVRIVVKEVKQNKNLLMGGVRYGYTFVSNEVQGNTIKTYSNKGLVFDISYFRRQVVNDFGVGFGIDTNVAPKAFIGYEF